MANYYEFLNILPTAIKNEIESAIDQKYNNWRSLINHHDPVIVEQANQNLRLLEQVRRTLSDITSRLAYDAELGFDGGVSGLADPDATMRANSSIPMTFTQNPPQKESVRIIDAWVCGKCKTSNQIGIKFCSNCGEQLGVNCPTCGQLTKISNIFCTGCGINLEESKKIGEEHNNAITWINQKKIDANKLKHSPTVRSVIAKGSFQDIHKICTETMSSFTGTFLSNW
jgi:hypothetical protein